MVSTQEIRKLEALVKHNTRHGRSCPQHSQNNAPCICGLEQILKDFKKAIDDVQRRRVEQPTDVVADKDI